MPKTNKTKKKVTITLDTEVIKIIKKRKYKASTLINYLLYKHFSQVPNPKSDMAFQAGDLGSNPGSCIVSKISDLGFEIGENPKNKQIRVSKDKVSNNNQNTHFCLKNTYFLFENKFEEFLINKGLTKLYVKDLLGTGLKLFSKIKDKSNIEDVLGVVNNKTVSNKYAFLLFRNLLSFWEESNIKIPQDTLIKIRTFKKKQNFRVDTFVPSNEDVKKIENLGLELSELDFIAIRVLIESGIRIKELITFFRELDIKKVSTHDNIMTYDIFSIRGNKSSFYIFISRELWTKIEPNVSKLRSYDIGRLKFNLTKHHLTPLKYLRKYNFSLLIKSGVNFEIANFIQGRSSKNIGFNHYLAKKEIAIEEYKKITNPTIFSEIK